MSEEMNKHTMDNERMKKARETWSRTQRLIDRVKNGEADESEIAELKALDEKINSVPDNVIRG